MKKQTLFLVLASALVLFTSFQIVRGLVHLLSPLQLVYLWPRLLLFVLGLVGLGQYLFTAGRISRLLHIWLFYTVFISLSVVVSAPLEAWLHLSTDSYGFYMHRQWILSLEYLPVLGAAYFCFMFLNQRRKAVLVEEIDGEDTQLVFHPVNGWIRFGNRVLDILFVTLFCASWFSSLTYSWSTHLRGNWLPFGNEQVYLQLVFALFLYYLVMESITGVTFGKLVTNTVIVNDAGLRPTYWQMLGRALSRMIPFESVSFLFQPRGLHDTISDTYVTKGKYSSQ